MKTITEVVKSNMCIGCGACTLYSTDTSMGYDERGFLVPVENHGINIEDFCPGIKTKPIPGDRVDKLWGNIKNSYTGYSADNEVRYKGSSGGVLTQIAISLLEEGSISGVLHIGASSCNGITNESRISKDRYSILNNAGSRYSPSSVLDKLQELSNMDGKYLVIGRPCDIAAVRALSEKEPKIASKIYMIASFFCAGTPSQHATKDLIAMFDVSSEQVESITYRGDGWPGKTKIKTEFDVFKLDYEDSWGRVLNKKLHTRCKICADGIGESADIVCADAWDCDDKGYPVFTEGYGQSLILTRSDRGSKAINRLVSRKALEVNNFDVSSLVNIQPYQVNRKRNVLARSIAFRVLGKKIVKQSNYRTIANAIDNGIYRTLSNFYGMFRRILSNKIGI